MKILKEAALEQEVKKEKENQCKLSSKTKLLMKKCRDMKMQAARDNMESLEFTKTINKKGQEDMKSLT